MMYGAKAWGQWQNFDIAGRGTHRFSRALAVPLLGLALLFLAGCGPKRDSTVKATGTVVYQGQPVAKAQVMFLGEGHASASGTTDEQGRFTLFTYAPGDGAVPGKYKVGVVKREPVVDPKNPNDPYAPMRDLLPAKYVNPSNSPLQVEVMARGPNDFKLDLAE